MTPIKRNLSVIRLSLSLAAAMVGVDGSWALAEESCGCDQACTEKCEKGETKDCACKSCNHGKEGHKCEGKCDHDHGDQPKAKAKSKAKPKAKSAPKTGA